jgi:hypothetical protein
LNGIPAPCIDLNGPSQGGTQYEGVFAVGIGPIRIASSEASLEDVDGSTLASMVVALTNAADGACEVLTADTSGTAVVASYVNGVLTLGGAGTLAEYREILRSIEYKNTAARPTLGDRTIEVASSDGHRLGNVAVSTVTVSMDYTFAFEDADLAKAVRDSLGLAENEELTGDVLQQLTSVQADSNLVDSLLGLQYATSLESLRLIPADFSVTSELASLTPIENLENLTTLVLQGVGLDDSDLAPIAGMSQLEVLDLSFNEIAGAPAAFPSLSSLAFLKSLDLRYNSVEVVPQAVADVSTLETLFVHGNPIDGDPQAGMAHLAGKIINVDLLADHPDEAKDVADLANRLYNLPLKMYEYVLNTIEFEPYRGSMKGTEAVLQTGKGNAWDTSVFFADLLEKAGIQVRYVHGVVQLPVDSQSAGRCGVESWLGVATPTAALKVLNGAYLDATNIDVGDDTVAVQFDHLWPEANVEIPGVGSQWVAFDASVKFRDCRESVRNMLSEVTFDTSAVSGDYFATARTDSPHEYFEGLVRDYLAENEPTTSITDIPYAGPIVAQAIHAVPATFAYDIISQETAVAEIPASETYRLRVTLTNTSGTTTYFQTNQLSLPEIGTMPLTVRPTPSGTNYVIPELLLNWENDARSVYDLLSISNPVALPRLTGQVKLRLECFYPDGVTASSAQSEYQRWAVDYMAVALDANQLSRELIEDQWRMVNEASIAYGNDSSSFDIDENAGYLMHLAGMKYMFDTNRGEDVICQLTGATRSVSLPASGLVTAALPLQNWTSSTEIGFLSAIGPDFRYRYWAMVSDLD